jgi:sulfite exporter TauE/SafE
MAAFGLGTVPMMLGISLSGKLVPAPLRIRLRRAIPFGVCLLAGLLILRGLSLGIPYVSPDLTAATPVCCTR